MSRAFPYETKKPPGQVVWFFGLSGSGKSTLSNELQKYLEASGAPSVMLDGDRLREGMSRDLGFTTEDRTENIRRAAELAKLLSEQGFLVICNFITPRRSQRETVSTIIGSELLLVYVDAPLETCAERDPKGLYKKAITGEIKNFSGISDGFEAPTEEPNVLSIDNRDIGFEPALKLIRARLRGLPR